ncbi:MAG: tyrosine-protein phosphatase [Clostridiales bacterium]|nr:tyrosine-protein phosphatase [Clostridiales bacterium]
MAAELRRLPLERADNVRDLGGHSAAGGLVTRWRTFLRADQLGRLSDADKRALLALGLTTVLDLRSPTEALRAPEPFTEADGVACYPLPFASEAAIDEFMTSGAEFRELYVLLAEKGRRKIAKAFRLMARCGGLCLFHCHAGKDRTGILAALLLLLVGVGREDVIADYEVSGTYYRRAARGELRPDDTEELVEQYTSSHASTIRYFIRYIDAKYGGAAGYLRAAGLADEDARAIREKFLAPPRINMTINDPDALRRQKPYVV